MKLHIELTYVYKKTLTKYFLHTHEHMIFKSIFTQQELLATNYIRFFIRKFG